MSLNYKDIQEGTITGRYVTHKDIDLFLSSVPNDYKIRTEGASVEERPIKSITIGKGELKIMMWSQMHGNESTTTKAVLDLMNFLKSDSDLARSILTNCTLKIIPILNPDGAMAYTRVNANKVDLNRDAQERTQPESVVLREIYGDFRPDYCFNLHDQRTIFNVGNTPRPATVSFLAPAHDPERSISKTRGISMQLIVAMNEELQKHIPGQVGRYDDGFNSNCVGDTFQMLNIPTILFESGHFPKDYDREETRKYIFTALLKAIEVISKSTIGQYNLDSYFDIPDNNKLFFDIIIRNIHILDSNSELGTSAAILFVETLVDGKIEFKGKLEEIGDLRGKFGHKTYNCLFSKDLKELKNKTDIVELLGSNGIFF
ncbi:M14 metallopeptidase family protein [Arenibacter sp. F20364]|uniref:M14 family metallopeptidase n=1 Tax=Arenibacter sp. F20364 TaxID=2926415 RepID=UPI001FF48522|nr:M14 metallopeptidase family protein [Arenibacter sp. F20364]MCK0191155.1 M14 family metallopeptidase [Arenibacter sp. F20364]